MRLSSYLRRIASPVFQFTHPGGVRRDHLHIYTDGKGFNSRTREGCDTKGRVYVCVSLCFNSRTREGCDLLSPIVTTRLSGCFNSRTREGCDCCRRPCYPLSLGFNSRTREGCDGQALNRITQAPCFNSRTREGCDFLVEFTVTPLAVFQFTHPGGVRPRRARCSARPIGFNSRTREGCDFDVCYLFSQVFIVSIHAPGRGATH